jgi:hypothetical protein
MIVLSSGTRLMRVLYGIAMSCLSAFSLLADAPVWVALDVRGRALLEEATTGAASEHIGASFFEGEPVLVTVTALTPPGTRKPGSIGSPGSSFVKQGKESPSN